LLLKTLLFDIDSNPKLNQSLHESGISHSKWFYLSK
jgi:hypothetical protein